MKTQPIWGFILLLFVIGCAAPQATPAPTAWATAPTAVTQTQPASPTLESPAPATEATSTPEPSPTPQPPTPCQQILDQSFPKDFLTEGSLIFSGECEGREGLFKLSAGSNKLEPFLEPFWTDSYPDNIFTSLEHQWLTITGYNMLMISGEDDKTSLHYPIDRKNWGRTLGWLRDNLLQIDLSANRYNHPRTRIVLDPFSGKTSLFEYTPQEDLGFRHVGVGYPEEHSPLVFDSPLARAIYLNATDDESRYVLEEISSKKILWRGPASMDIVYYAGDPIWSPNGKYVGIPAWQEDGKTFQLFVVSRDGTKEIASPMFQDGNTNSLGQAYFRWSPSGKYLTAWVKLDNGENRLAFWEPFTNQVTYPLSRPISATWRLPKFTGSDQKFVFYDSNSGGTKQTLYVVDTSTGEVTAIPIHLDPVAWLNTTNPIPKPPSEPKALAPKPGTSVSQACMVAQPESPKPNFKGELVITKFSNEFELFSQGADQSTRQLADTYEGHVSPDGKWLFYITTDAQANYHFWLYKPGQTPQEINIEEIIGYRYYELTRGWFNDTELWVATRDGILLFNPFTNKYRKAPTFPELEVGDCVDEICPAPLYDQAFERHLLLSGGFPIFGLYLQNPDGQVLWQHTSDFTGWNIPQWQPGDQLLAAPLVKQNDKLGEHYEFFAIDRDGRQRQITNYTAAYPTMSIDQFSWSPDGRFIAFWGDTHSKTGIAQQNPYRLFVLDTQTRQTTDYCVTGNYSGNQAPVWSPDGNQLAVESIQGDQNLILLVDLASRTTSMIGEAELIGWLAPQE